MGNIGKVLFISLFFIITFNSFDIRERAYAADKTTNLGFTPFDTAVDPVQAVVYMTDIGSKVIYAVNYETGIVKSLELPYAAERLELYKQKLYVTQLKRSHNRNNDGPYDGGIAIVDTANFKLDEVMKVEADPYDIAIDKKGFIYITPGSGQFSTIKVYSLTDKKEVVNNRLASVYQSQTIYYNERDSKLYTIDSELTPRDFQAFETDNGVIIDSYDSPYHGDYNLAETAKISPDGQTFYNYKTAFNLTSVQSGDMIVKLQFPHAYNDFAFNLDDQLTFAANTTEGIDVYRYNTEEYLYSLNQDMRIEQLLFKDGLLAIEKDSKSKYYLHYWKDTSADKMAVKSQSLLTYNQYNKPVMTKLENKAKNVPIDSGMIFSFSQGILKVDQDKISVTSDEGEVPFTVNTEENKLTIQPVSLLENTNYSVTIQPGAVTGYEGEKQEESHTLFFTTRVPDITGLTLSVNRDESPLKYVFTANASGGFQPQYQFSISENNKWVTLQKYSSSRSLIWKPNRKGKFQFLVETRSNGSVDAKKQVYTFTEEVIDNELPIVTLSKNTDKLSNKAVRISVSGSDNVGIKEITLPDGKIVNDSQAVYTAIHNGEYTFEVEDLLGNVSTKSLIIDQIDQEMPDFSIKASTEKPTKNNVILSITTFDNRGIRGIQLPNGIFVDDFSTNFTVSKNGVYQFKVEDLAGNIVTKSIAISNIYKSLPTIPTVYSIGDSNISINGKSTSNFIAYAKISSKKIYSAKVSSKGTFKITIPKQKAGTKILVYVKNPVGLVSKTKTITVIDNTPPVTPKVNTVTSSTKVMTGKSEKNSIVYVYKGNKYIKKGSSDSKGNFRLTIGKQKKSTILTVYALDQSKNKSKTIKIKVK